MKHDPNAAVSLLNDHGFDMTTERALKMLVLGQPLEDVLGELCANLESFADVVQIHVLLHDGSAWRSTAAASLDNGWLSRFLAQQAQQPLPCAARCANRAMDICEDVLVDDAWDTYRPACATAPTPIRAIWTLPILSFDGTLLALLQAFGAAPGLPEQELLRRMCLFAKLAGVAILRHHAEVARERLTEDLKMERIERETLSMELQQAARAREEFMCIAAHELRTPLSALMLQADSAARLLTRSELPAERLSHKVTSMQKQIDRLKHLVEDLLDVSAVAAGTLRLRFEPCDLGTLTQQAIERCAESYARARCELRAHIEGPATGRWDSLRVSQVVTNLLMNALKYGMGAPVDVRVESTDKWSRLVVHDQGIGIAPEQQRRIFERFGRAVSEKNYGGFGQGLWLSKQIVNAMNGTIEVHSAQNAGATFIVELPRLQAPIFPGEITGLDDSGARPHI